MSGEIKTNLVPEDVPQAVADLGIKIGKVDYKEVWCLCPFHMEELGRPDHKIGSFSININTGNASCFGCGRAGIFADVVSAHLGVDHAGALDWLLRRDVRTDTWKEDDDYYEEIVYESMLAAYVDPPEEELEYRGIDIAACKTFGVCWDAKRGGWILPIRDPETASLWGWQWKRNDTVRNYPRKVPKRKTLFGLDTVTSKDLVVVESPLDAVKIHAAGYDCVATFGAKVSEDQRLLLINNANRIVLALDDDGPGRLALSALLPKMESRSHIYLYRYDGKAKDPGNMTYKEIEEAIETAIPSIDV